MSLLSKLEDLLGQHASGNDPEIVRRSQGRLDKATASFNRAQQRLDRAESRAEAAEDRAHLAHQRAIADEAVAMQRLRQARQAYAQAQQQGGNVGLTGAQWRQAQARYAQAQQNTQQRQQEYQESQQDYRNARVARMNQPDEELRRAREAHAQNTQPSSTAQRIGNVAAGGLNWVREGLQQANTTFDNPYSSGGMITAGDERSLQKGFKGFLGSLQSAAGHGIAALKEEDSPEVGAELALSGGAAARKIPVAGRPIEAFAKLSAEILGTVERLKKWGDQLERSNFQFAEFSGAMTRVQVQSEIREMQLSAERGERRATTADFQSQARFRLERDLASFDDLWAKGKNVLSGILDNAIASLIEKTHLNDLADIAGAILDAMVGDQEGNDAFKKELEEAIKRGEEASKTGRPSRHGLR